MPQPLSYDLHVARPLQNVAIAYQQDESEFIADKVFPVIPVKKESDRYMVFDKSYWFRTVAAQRAPATESVGTGYRIDNTPFYNATNWAVHVDVPVEDYANADDPLDPDVDATELVTRHLLIRREKLFAAQYMSPNVWQGFSASGSITDFSPSVNGHGYWDDANSNPILDVANLRVGVKRITGHNPNTLVLTENVKVALKSNAAIQDRFKYTGTEVTDTILARLFEVDRVLTMGAVLNSAQEGQAASMSFLATNGFLLCYAAPAPGIRKPSAGYTFSWTGRPGSNGLAITVKRMYMELREAYRIEGSMAFAFAQTGKDLGVFGASVLRNP